MTAKPLTPPPADLFGAGAPEEAPPRLSRALSPYLRHDPHGDKAPGLLLTNPGMAAIAEPERGKRGEVCRCCIFWGEPGNTPPRDSWGTLKPAPCRKYSQLMHVPPGNCNHTLRAIDTIIDFDDVGLTLHCWNCHADILRVESRD
jgi:hypothetical protein